MLTVSNNFMSKMMSNNRVIDSYVLINSVRYDSDRIIGWSFHDTISLAEVFEIGTSIANSLDITLQGFSGSGINFVTAIIEPYVGVNVGGSTFEYVPLGKFNVVDFSFSQQENQQTLNCLDNMIKLDIPYTWIAGSTDTIANVMSRISTLTGISLAGTYPATVINKSTGYSCRQMLGFMAGLLGGNGIIDRTGKIAIKKLTTNETTNSGNTYVGGSAVSITFDTNISNYVTDTLYNITVNTASRTAWDGLGVKVGDFVCNGGGLSGVNPSLGTITAINGYSVTIRADMNLTDSSPATWVDYIGRRNNIVMSIGKDNYFEKTDGTDSYIIDKVTGIDFNGNSFSTGSVINNKELKFTNPFVTQSIIDSLNYLVGFMYFPFTLDWQGNPALESGDNILVNRGVKMPVDTVLTYPDFSAFTQHITESQYDNQNNVIGDIGDEINSPNLIGSTVTNGMNVATNNGGTSAPSFNNGYYGIHLNNNDIRGINALVFQDSADGNASEGILFAKSTAPSDSNVLSDYDNLQVTDGKLTVGTNVIYDPSPTWTNLSLGGGATVNNSRTPKYTKIGGVVHLEGEISSGLANGTIFATLPALHRPASYSLNIACAHATSTQTNPAVISVNITGQLTLISSNGTNAVSLNNISFVAEV